MGPPAAKRGDRVNALDTHLIQPPGPTSPVSVPHAFSGVLDGGLSRDVRIGGRAAATVRSTATNTPRHVPQGGSFVKPPSNKARVVAGSSSVFINGKAAARAGDAAMTCNDPADQPIGKIVASGSVRIGG